MDTIVALSSGAPPSAIAVVRASGPRVREMVERLAGRLPEPRVAALRTLVDEGEAIDRGLVLFFPAPHSFTGEDCAEFQVHGSAPVVSRLVAALTRKNAGKGARTAVRLAEPGEFARRAFLNGRLDLTEVEGLADLVAAETEEQRRAALALAEGGLRARVEDWRERVLRLRAQVEALLDFSDEEDVGEAIPAGFNASLTMIHDELEAARASAARGRRVRTGFRVALMGAPNAGKSTLLNALSRSDAAIVSARAGTTRDVIEVRADLGGHVVTLVDTAGLREAGDEIEREGVARARRAGEAADLVLWLCESDVLDLPDEMRTRPHLVLQAKGDLEREPAPWAELSVSALSGAGLRELEHRLSDLAGEGGGGVTLTRERQEIAVSDAATALEEARNEGDPVLIAEHLRAASAALDRLSGRSDVEGVLDRLFAEFCIGK